jgi:hypothetical protein
MELRERTRLGGRRWRPGRCTGLQAPLGAASL